MATKCRVEIREDGKTELYHGYYKAFTLDEGELPRWYGTPCSIEEWIAHNDEEDLKPPKEKTCPKCSHYPMPDICEGYHSLSCPFNRH